MGEFWHGLVGFCGYALQEISHFGLWLALGGGLGLLLGVLCAAMVAQWIYPRRGLDALDEGRPPLWRWLFLCLPLLRWSWWLSWWAAIPACCIALGLIWGSAQGVYQAVLHQRITPEVSRRAAQQLVCLLWSQAEVPSDYAKVDAEKQIPASVLFPALLKVCQTPLVCKYVPGMQKRDKLGWLADLAARKAVGWYMDCEIESRKVYIEAVRQELCGRPTPACHSASLRQVAEAGCQKYVEPKLALWCYEWILALAGEFVEILLLLIVLPRLAFEVVVAALKFLARRRAGAGAT